MHYYSIVEGGDAYLRLLATCRDWRGAEPHKDGGFLGSGSLDLKVYPSISMPQG